MPNLQVHPMSEYRPPRVSDPHLTHVGVCILWAEDRSHCRARYQDWNVATRVDPFDAINPEFRKAVEDALYERAIEPFR